MRVLKCRLIITLILDIKTYLRHEDVENTFVMLINQ